MSWWFMNCRLAITILWIISAHLGALSPAAEPEVGPKDLPRVPPTEPDKALSTFRVKPGFRLELVAAEPLVVDPIAMSFDENGRLFVVEMRDYSERREERLGRIRLLEDTDGDGRFDKSTVYADNLPWPTAVICYGGGIFVGATPDIIYFKDTNGDGVADVRQVVFTGFGNTQPRLNVQQLFNSFMWGLDDRIHGASAGNGGTITKVNAPAVKPLDLRGRDFAFDPRALDMSVESGGGQYGFCLDDRGRKFICSNSSHIRTVMFEDRYLGLNSFYAAPAPSVDIAVDGPAAEVYRISPDEPWRVIRTKWRVAGLVPGPIEGGGRASGYFTGATGITIYRGDAWPADFRGDAFVADCGSNLIHRKKLRPDGVGLKAERPGDEQKVEFLASTDNWFRPVQMANAPDGALYVADMYREVIEHPWSLPESIKKHLDLNSGNDRGRIYRIVPEGFKQPKRPQPGKATTRELVAMLEHRNGWHRDTASRLLFERQDPSAAPLLKGMIEHSKSPLGRLHALYALNGLGGLTDALILQALADADPVVRQHAVRLSERIFSDRNALAERAWNRLKEMIADPAPEVRYQLAFTLGEIPYPDRVNTQTELIRRDIESRWVQTATLISLREGVDTMLAALSPDPRVSDSPAGQEFIRQLALMIGARNQPAEISRVLDSLGESTKAEVVFPVALALGDGLQRAGRPFPGSGGLEKFRPVFARANKVLNESAATEAIKLQAIKLLGYTPFTESGATLLAVLEPNQPQAMQLAVVSGLSRMTDSNVGPELIRHWPSLTPRVRSEALTILLARPERAGALLAAMEAGTISRVEMPATQVQFLRTHRDAGLRERALRLFGSTPSGTLDEVVKSFEPALQLKGGTARGEAIYVERCASCHRSGERGHAVGPDLVTVKSSGKEKLLINILDPNREVAPNYLNFVVETKDGESLMGLIANETSASVTLRRANSEESVVLRSNITSIQSQNQSVMPEGLEAGLSSQDMADLLEFIAAAK